MWQNWGFYENFIFAELPKQSFSIGATLFQHQEQLIFQIQTKCFLTEKLDMKPLFHNCTMKNTFSIHGLGVIPGSIGKEDLEQYPHPCHALKLQVSIIRVEDSILSLLPFCIYMPWWSTQKVPTAFFFYVTSEEKKCKSLVSLKQYKEGTELYPLCWMFSNEYQLSGFSTKTSCNFSVWYLTGPV